MTSGVTGWTHYPPTNNVDSPPAISQKPSNKPLTDERSPSGKNKTQNLASGLFSRFENDTDLAYLVQAWPDLPDHIKQTILDLVRHYGAEDEQN